MSNQFVFHAVRWGCPPSPPSTTLRTGFDTLRVNGEGGGRVRQPFVLSRSKHAGFSVLDLLITLFVLALVLLAAVKQFGSYQQPATPPAAEEQPTPGQPSAPPQ